MESGEGGEKAVTSVEEIIRGAREGKVQMDCTIETVKEWAWSSL